MIYLRKERDDSKQANEIMNFVGTFAKIIGEGAGLRMHLPNRI